MNPAHGRWQRLGAGILALGVAGGAGVRARAAAPVPPTVRMEAAVVGAKFPAWSFPNLNAGAGGSPRIDLASVIGKKPIVFYYWMAGNARSEKMFQDLQTIVEGLGVDRVVLYGIAAPPVGSSDTAAIRSRVQSLKIRVPVLHDEVFRLAQQLNVRSVPFIAIVDKGGVLRLTNGGSLTQAVAYKMNVEDAIRRVATTGELGTYGELARYEPVTEFIGKKSPEFELPSIEDGTPRHWNSLAASDKINVLIFWSIDCAHCTLFMPKFNTWLKDHREGINVISIGKVLNDAMKTKTREFTKTNGFVFPTLADTNFAVAQEFQVTGTPTILIVRPDGIVDAVMPPGEGDFDKYFTGKRKQLLGRS